MRRIHKYELKVGENKVELPVGYEFLSVVEQYNRLVFYAMVDPRQEEKEEAEFYVAGTGWDLEEKIFHDFVFVDTVTALDGKLVWHIFFRLPF